MKITFSKYHLAFVFIVLLLPNCMEDEAVLTNEDLIFTNSFHLKIPPYEYFDTNGKAFFVRGDTNYQSNILDTLNNMPAFAWDSIGLKIISLAIFNSPISVMNSEIVNSEDIVWKWHSGMNFGKEGLVQYSDGKDVIDGVELESVTPLTESTYYWGVWAWNTSGNRILYSSRQMKFYVLE